MVVTRSQSGEEARGRVFDEPPRSPSTNEPGTGRRIPVTSAAAAASVTTDAVTREARGAPLAPLHSVASESVRTSTNVPAAVYPSVVHTAASRPAPYTCAVASRPTPAPCTSVASRPAPAPHSGAVQRTEIHSRISPDRSVRSGRSQRSSTSATVRIRQAELVVAEKLAELQRSEIRLQADLLKKKLAFEIATIQDEENEVNSVRDQNIDRVNLWLSQQVPTDHEPTYTEEPSATVQPETVPYVDVAAPTTAIDTHATADAATAAATTVPVQQSSTPHVHAYVTRGERQHEDFGGDTPRHRPYERQRSPTPHRSRSNDRGIDRLAEAIAKMARTRAPPKQVIDLPTFTGAPGEWLPFKAAMRDSAEIYKFTDVENMARLRNSLKGEAREAVRALLHTTRDPEIVMKTLEQCFGRPEIIVDQALEDIKKLPRPGASATDINNLAVKLQNIVQVLNSLDQRGYLYNPLLVREVIDKLSPHLRSRWCDFAEDNCSYDEPQIVTLSKFLMKEADRALKHAYMPSAVMKTTKPTTTAATKPAQKSRAATYATTTDPAEEERCLYCNEVTHKVPHCDKFKKLNVEDRWNWAREKKVCFKCINKMHRRLICKAKPCGIDGCTRHHHSLLHVRKAVTTSPAANAAPTTDGTVLTVQTSPVQRSKVLLKICPVTVIGPGGEEDTFALLDEGSTATLIDAELARKINARGPASTLQIHGVNSTRQEQESHRVKIKLRSNNEHWEIAARTVEGLRLTTQSVPAHLMDCAHLRDLPVEKLTYDSATPRLLIGADNWDLIITRELKTGRKDEPAASRTRLGWVVHGVAPRKPLKDEASILHFYTKADDDMKLEDQVEAHFRIDSLGVTSAVKVSPENQRAVKIFEDTVTEKNGHYEVGLTWKVDNPKMPASYDRALKRLKTIEKKMDSDADFASQYSAQIKNLIDKGYAEECNGKEREQPHSWFLPHFAVTNPNKPGKIRLVFDAAAVANGTSLNDMLLEGPDLLRSLMGILFKFRECPIAVTADIEEMFLQVKIREEDQAAQLFLWREREDRRKPPKEMKMTSMIFGASCSPFLAHSVRNHNAHVHASSHPAAFTAITENHYMDDFVNSYNNKEETVRAINEVVEVHAKAGFRLRGWNSNEEGVLTNVPAELRAKTNTQLGHDNKTLGLFWDPREDTLGFNTTMPRVPDDVRNRRRTPTKREALSAVMSVYDPLGLLSCFTISAKIFLQNLWRLQIGWDEPLPEEYTEGLMTWLEQLNTIATLRLSRRYGPETKPKKRQLHIFCDASQDAYAAAAYWRLEMEDGTIHVVLAAAKSKVAPIKTQSIPRLELQAALVGVRLADTIQREHRWEADDVIFWTDSRTVLHWIQKNSRRYTPFVAHRLGEIAEKTDMTQWRWAPTNVNVADVATRVNYVPIDADDWWFTGPDFLKKDEDYWPERETPTEDEDTEVIHHVSLDHGTSPLPNFERFSTYQRLLRATASVLLFIDKCRHRESHMTPTHLDKAEKLLLKKVQEDSFPEEIALLRGGKPIMKTSRLKKLDPELDEDGLLRLRGRVDAANLPQPTKRPAILDGKHKIVRLIVLQEHVNAGHAGRERVVNELRQKYWILKLRPTVRAVARACQLCRVRNSKPCVPICGDLPAARVDYSHRPFTNCGVDYFGPMTITIGRRREKRWGALFTCLTTRAVHLEIVGSLTTDSAIMALRRMAARRGWPAVMYSDNATNFRGADVELRTAYTEWAPALKDFGLQHRMEWHFIPPGAPNQGGAWERLVRSVKVALKAVLHEKTPREEVLQTVLIEAEHSINARPLTHVSVEPDDPEALTPNHFLLGSSSGLPRTGPCDVADRRTWRATQALADEFWRRWVKEYLPTLVARGESRDNTRRPLQPGDLVIVVDPTLPRNTWPRGVVETVHAGPDGGIRSADVRTRGGVFRRPTSKLAVLTVDMATQSLRRGEDEADSGA